MLSVRGGARNSTAVGPPGHLGGPAPDPRDHPTVIASPVSRPSGSGGRFDSWAVLASGRLGRRRRAPNHSVGSYSSYLNNWGGVVHSRPRPPVGHNRRVNTLLRILLLIWVVGYLFVSCAPLLQGHLIIGGITFIAGVVLFLPWLAVTIFLAGLIWLTRPPRRP
jgi:hypothetical protein